MLLLISQRGGIGSGHLCVHACVSEVSVCMGGTEGRGEGGNIAKSIKLDDMNKGWYSLSFPMQDVGSIQ